MNNFDERGDRDVVKSHQPRTTDVVIGDRPPPDRAPANGVVLGDFEAEIVKLQDLLKQQQWQAADLETTAMMLNMGGRQHEGFLRIEDIQNLDYHHLKQIDNLWKTYSNNQFGFSIQAEIWRSVGGTAQVDWHAWCRFGSRTGWYVGWYDTGDTWIWWNDAKFSLNAPRGHLPRGGAFIGWGFGDFWVGCAAMSAIGEKLGCIFSEQLPK
jgi:GUN4-like